MRVTSKTDGDNFVRRIIAQTKEKPIKDRVIVTDPTKVDTKDEAKQEAVCYWMMGWNWDEIESVLEDSEYSNDIIKYALREAKEYAKKILNEGPFAVMIEKQGVKLVNGSVGVLEEKYSDYVVVRLPDGCAQVTAEHIDMEATKKLYEAHTLRKKAAKMVLAQEPISMHAPVEEGTSLINDVENAINTLNSIQKETNELKADATELHTQWMEKHAEWKTKSKEEYTFAQLVAAIITEEKNLDEEITDLVHNKLGNSLISLYNVLLQQPAESATLDKIEAFLDENFKKIAQSIEGHLYKLQGINEKIGEYVQHFITFQDKQGAEWAKDAISWASKAWDQTKEFVKEWESSLEPTAIEGISLIGEFLAEVSKQQTTASIQKIFKNRV